MKRFFLITVFLFGLSVLLFSQEYVTVTWGSSILTYNGFLQTPTATAFDSMNNSVALNVTVASPGDGIDAGGPYLAWAMPVNTSAYATSHPTDTFSYYIDPALCIVQWGSSLFTYNSFMQVPNATTTDLFGGNLPLTVSLRSGYNGTDAGVHLVEANLYPYQNNYWVTEVPYSYTILPAPRAVSWGNTSLAWNGYPQVPTASVTDLLGAPLSITVSGEQTDIGAGYLATATFSTTVPNYALSNTTTTFSINLPLNPLVFYTQWDVPTFTYNGYPQAPSASAVNYLGGSLKLAVIGQGLDAGTGYTAIAFPNDPNVVDPTLIDNSTVYSILPAPAAVNWGNTSLPYNGKQQAPTAIATGVLNEDLQLSVSGMQTNMGTGYLARASLLPPNGNYDLNNKTIRFEITAAPITIQWGNTSFIYNGNPHAPTATATDVLGYDLPLTVTGAQTDIGIGYIATASQTYPNNYYTLVNPTTVFDILSDPDTVIVEWGDKSLTYNGSLQAPTATATGPDGEQLMLIVTGEQTDVGTGYTATASLRSPSFDYVLENTTTLFDITPANIPIQWSNKTFTYNGNPQMPTASATGVIGEGIPVSVTGVQTNVGTDYIATATVNAVYDNYTFSNLTALFDITPETLAITAISVTIEHGQTPTLDYTITSGRLFGSDALTGTLSVETLQATSLLPPYPPGIHVIAQGTLTAGSNYLINFTEGVLTVISLSTEIFDILVNDKSAERRGDIFYAPPAENGEAQALVNVLSNIFGTITINGVNQNPSFVDLKYGENNFTIEIMAQNGNTQDYTLLIERYYEKVFYEYPDVPSISCNPKTNGGYTFTGFQWYGDNTAISEATGPYLQIKDNASYHCELTPNDGVKFRTINILPQAMRSLGALTAYPNPTQGKVTIQQKGNLVSPQNESSGKMKIQVFDVYGVLVLQPETNPFDMSALHDGLYFINVNGETTKVIKKN